MYGRHLCCPPNVFLGPAVPPHFFHSRIATGSLHDDFLSVKMTLIYIRRTKVFWRAFTANNTAKSLHSFVVCGGFLIGRFLRISMSLLWTALC